jgi:hypothetical protein
MIGDLIDPESEPCTLLEWPRGWWSPRPYLFYVSPVGPKRQRFLHQLLPAARGGGFREGVDIIGDHANCLVWIGRADIAGCILCRVCPVSTSRLRSCFVFYCSSSLPVSTNCFSLELHCERLVLHSSLARCLYPNLLTVGTLSDLWHFLLIKCFSCQGSQTQHPQLTRQDLGPAGVVDKGKNSGDTD